MRVTIIQPAYLPWLGYFQRILHSDVCISLDHVKIDWHSKTQFTNRNKVLTQSGPIWLTVPLRIQSSQDMAIHTIHIDNKQKWQKKHWETIRQSYAKAPYGATFLPFMSTFYSTPFEVLIDVLEQSTNFLLQEMSITTPIFKSSTLGVAGAKDDLVLNLCKKFRATQYISGPFGRDYLDKRNFESAGIEVLFHDFMPVKYPQRSESFTPYLSTVDMLFNIGREEGAKLLQGININDNWHK